MVVNNYCAQIFHDIADKCLILLGPLEGGGGGEESLNGSRMHGPK